MLCRGVLQTPLYILHSPLFPRNSSFISRHSSLVIRLSSLPPLPLPPTAPITSHRSHPPHSSIYSPSRVCELFVPRPSSLVIRPSSFVSRHSSLVIRLSSFVSRHSSLVIRLSSLVIRNCNSFFSLIIRNS